MNVCVCVFMNMCVCVRVSHAQYMYINPSTTTIPLHTTPPLLSPPLHHQDTRAPGEFKDKGTPIHTAKIHNVRMGAGSNSYLIREGAIGVMRNVRGGVQDTGTSFAITPTKGGGGVLTPSRVLLAKGERQMNMLTPTRKEAVFQTDIETGKVCLCWWGYTTTCIHVSIHVVLQQPPAYRHTNIIHSNNITYPTRT